jgi:hypothetical protein
MIELFDVLKEVLQLSIQTFIADYFFEDASLTLVIVCNPHGYFSGCDEFKDEPMIVFFDFNFTHESIYTEARYKSSKLGSVIFPTKSGGELIVRRVFCCCCLKDVDEDDGWQKVYYDCESEYV